MMLSFRRMRHEAHEFKFRREMHVNIGATIALWESVLRPRPLISPPNELVSHEKLDYNIPSSVSTRGSPTTATRSSGSLKTSNNSSGRHILSEKPAFGFHTAFSPNIRHGVLPPLFRALPNKVLESGAIRVTWHLKLNFFVDLMSLPSVKEHGLNAKMLNELQLTVHSTCSRAYSSRI